MEFHSNAEDPREESSEVVDRLIEEQTSLSEQVRSYDWMDSRRFKVLRENYSEFAGRRFEQMVRRVESETDYLDEIDDTVEVDNLIRGLEQGDYPTQVAFGQDKELNPTEDHASERESPIKGAFDHETGEIRVGEEAPDPQLLWAQFMDNFIRPQILATLDHEIVHYYSNKASRGGGFKYFKKKVAETVVMGAFVLALKGRDRLSKEVDNNPKA